MNCEWKEMPGLDHGGMITSAMPDVFKFFNEHRKREAKNQGCFPALNNFLFALPLGLRCGLRQGTARIEFGHGEPSEAFVLIGDCLQLGGTHDVLEPGKAVGRALFDQLHRRLRPLFAVREHDL